MSSRIRIGLPNFLYAAFRASSFDIPRAIFSSVSIWRYASSSRARSLSQALRRKKRVQAMALVRFRWAQYAIDGAHQFIPAAGLRSQLFPAGRRQPVVAGLAVILRRAPERCDPTAILDAVQCRIKRSVLRFEDIRGASLDRIRDGMPVRGPRREGSQDQHIESALQHFALERRRVSFRHKDLGTILLR